MISDVLASNYLVRLDWNVAGYWHKAIEMDIVGRRVKVVSGDYGVGRYGFVKWRYDSQLGGIAGALVDMDDGWYPGDRIREGFDELVWCPLYNLEFVTETSVQSIRQEKG